MGLISKVLYLKETKDLIEDGLYNVGANITEYDTFRSYPDIIDDLYNNWPRVTDSGESVSLDQTMEAPLDIDLKGNTSQTGTPTPSSPIPVNVVSGDNTITISNTDNTQSQSYPLYLGVENLFDYTMTPTAGSGGGDISIATIDNGFVLTCKSTNDYLNERYLIRNIEGYAGEKVTISCSINGTYPGARRVNVLTCDSTGNNRSVLASILETQNGSYSVTATLPTTFTSTNNYLMLAFYSSTDTAPVVNNYVIYTNIQLEFGSKANSYTPYGTTPIELCKIGTYQDYFYKNGDKWYLHKEVGKVVLNGSETWTPTSLSTTVYRFQSAPMNLNAESYVYQKADGHSNYFNYFMEYSGDLTNERVYCENQRTYIITSVATTENDFKTWLSTHNTIVYYVLATPTNTEITNATLINQLEALKGAMSYEGQTNISQVNNDLPFILSVEALKGSAE